MNLQIPDDALGPIKEALFQGRKIQAVKLYRECTQAGLAEAKNAVDKLEAELRSAFPDKFSANPAAKGCFGVVLVLCLVLAGLVRWLAGR
jgi:hypothetical protein